MIGIEKIDIEYNDTLASKYEQCHQAACLEYMNRQDIAKLHL
jgi:hypothetical protein